jgi:murein DD-endopeptidase MepM/ murein hydrolase activator NlpD
MVFSKTSARTVLTIGLVGIGFGQTGCLIRGESPDLKLRGSIAEFSETVSLSSSSFVTHQQDVERKIFGRNSTLVAQAPQTTDASGSTVGADTAVADNASDDAYDEAHLPDTSASSELELSKAAADAIGDFGGIPLIWPVETGKISSHFGMRKSRLHAGIDVSAPRGTPVKAAADGQILIASRKGAYGKVVIIEHASDRQTLYAHLDSFAVSEGDIVKAGEFIGRVGRTGRATGSHLHFETRIAGGVPRDPLAFLPRVSTILPKLSMKTENVELHSLVLK